MQGKETQGGAKVEPRWKPLLAKVSTALPQLVSLMAMICPPSKRGWTSLSCVSLGV